MYVTGRSKWFFLSYRREFPQLVVEVKRDEEICKRIHAILTDFYAEFDKALATLKAR